MSEMSSVEQKGTISPFLLNKTHRDVQLQEEMAECNYFFFYWLRQAHTLLSLHQDKKKKKMIH